MHCMKCINIFTFTPTSLKARPQVASQPRALLHTGGDPQLKILSGEETAYLGEILRGKAEELTHTAWPYYRTKQT